MTTADLHAILSERYRMLEQRVQSACARAGRRREEVSVVSVTKTISAELAAVLPNMGIYDLGENRPQELWQKAAILPEAVRWHLIGHLQRNKVERTLPLVKLIHSIDSERLLRTIEQEAGQQARTIPVLLEVNTTGEASKQGFTPDEVLRLSGVIGELSHARVNGLMTMAALEDDPERCRPTFQALRDLRDQLQQKVGGQRLEHLSMGMTNDFEIAIEEGATLVRIGTALFEGLEAT